MLICSGGKVWDMTDAASCNGLMKHSVEWVRSYVQAVGVRNPHTNPLRMATRQAPLPALSLRCDALRGESAPESALPGRSLRPCGSVGIKGRRVLLRAGRSRRTAGSRAGPGPGGAAEGAADRGAARRGRRPAWFRLRMNTQNTRERTCGILSFKKSANRVYPVC